MNVRRSSAVLAAVAAAVVVGAAAAPAAVADSAKPSPSSAPLPSGLYGKGDPKADGVFRQSYALLAQDTAGVKPATKAVDWLTGQQCASGGFAAFRADVSEPCDAKTPVDSNSTASAVQALAALGGQDKTVKKAVSWLKSVQNQDGGWGYNPGLKSDANSTSLVIGALAATGEKPASAKSQDGKSPLDALAKLAMDCDKDGGAFGLADFKTGKLSPNADATAAGVLGGLGQGLVVKPGAKQDSAPKCAKATDFGQATVNGTGYLLKTLAKDDHLTSTLPGSEDQPDYGNTADAVVALAAAGQQEQAKKSADWLAKNAADWAKKSGSPAAWAQLVLAAHASGLDPRDFGGTDLVKALNATGPAPQADAGSADSDKKKDSDDDGVSVWWIVGVGLVFGCGIGFLISGRNKKNKL
ncbi:prenyltransferase/squalene oxidase repeat-containing protein [Actinomycetota bacterium Odt1-20B]